MSNSMKLSREELEFILRMEYIEATGHLAPAVSCQWNYDAEGWVDSVTVVGYNPDPHQPKEQEA